MSKSTRQRTTLVPQLPTRSDHRGRGRTESVRASSEPAEPVFPTKRTLAEGFPHSLLVGGWGLQKFVGMNYVKKTHRIDPRRNRAAKKVSQNGVSQRTGQNCHTENRQSQCEVGIRYSINLPSRVGFGAPTFLVRHLRDAWNIVKFPEYLQSSVSFPLLQDLRTWRRVGSLWIPIKYPFVEACHEPGSRGLARR
jgi:hypothetical protein